MILSIAAQNKWNIHQMDVKSTFLNGILKEEVYINNHLVLLRKEARIMFISSQKSIV